MKILNRLFCLMMWVPAHQAAMAAQPFPLAGTWTLVAADRLLPDGARLHDYGDAPSGLMMIDSEGRYTVQIYQQGRPRFASGDKKSGSEQEFRATVEGSSTHFGRLTIDEPSRTLTFVIESAAFSNWEGTRQERRYELKGDELSYRVPARPDGQIPLSVWRRVNQDSALTQ
ncbi:lipocalin-like domain-containing protein [Duganella dendranthematis]|uniref:Lipocalin-like domain-containing protein n=1 Tax=Duganella dendranthematis TaxID=2728021 RepID=A0ABX6ME39_9BURK|nr:lipocalin-like domain-containing protein [Duganella dendranthematis]QJD92127.1 lipocalin-like domain-containing protein [Duganella dendranthematis]